MDFVTLTRQGGIATVTLNRPDHANSLDLPLAERLRDIARAVSDDEDVRCVVLTGNGRMFCAGGDVASFAAAENRKAFVTLLATTLHEALLSFLAMPKPLVVLVNGPAAGAGLGLALIGDVVLAARSAHFTAAYTRIGMTPDGGLTWLLPRLIGFRAAQEMILLNRKVTSDEAQQMGLITRAVEAEALAAEGATVSEQLATASMSALAKSRALLWKGATTALPDQLVAEANAIGESARSPDGVEGVAAFLSRRRPNFSGSSR